jgi:pantoate--beta-alanine ligase
MGLGKLRDKGIKIVGWEPEIVPAAEAVYPPGFQTTVDVRDVSKGLCGDRRPGHFAGVATVVLKLFSIVRPHVAVFGEKDYQQLCVVRRMVADLHLPIEVHGLPTVRESDGLAMSSRNRYLGPAHRARATALFRALSDARRLYQAGERQSDALLAAARAILEREVDRVDYLEVRDGETLAPLAVVDRQARILAAAFIAGTRLIDNVAL